MGSKTAMLAFSDGDPRLAGRPDPAEVVARVRAWHPEYDVTPIGGGSLGDYCYPPEDTCYATVLPGVELYCDRRLAGHLPSRLPGRLLRAGADRRITLHAMHSMSDSLSFAVWENGDLVRSLCLSPDDGIVENIGEPLACELPYWAGEHPASAESYPLPFHPLELGGGPVLRALFGFVVEGAPEPGDLDPFDVPLLAYGVADPTGREQAERRATMERLVARMRPPRRYELAPDDTYREITGERP